MLNDGSLIVRETRAGDEAREVQRSVLADRVDGRNRAVGHRDERSVFEAHAARQRERGPVALPDQRREHVTAPGAAK